MAKSCQTARPLILWISTVFIFNARGGMKYFTILSSFKAHNLALAA